MFFLHCKCCEAPLGICVNYPFLPSTSSGVVAMRMSKCDDECGDDTYKSHVDFFSVSQKKVVDVVFGQMTLISL